MDDTCKLFKLDNGVKIKWLSVACRKQQNLTRMTCGFCRAERWRVKAEAGDIGPLGGE